MRDAVTLLWPGLACAFPWLPFFSAWGSTIAAAIAGEKGPASHKDDRLAASTTSYWSNPKTTTFQLPAMWDNQMTLSLEAW
jgi:hypothetical protein